MNAFFRWKVVSDAKDGVGAASGEIKADATGCVTVPQLTSEPATLRLQPAE